jgi:hypothetical protein
VTQISKINESSSDTDTDSKDDENNDNIMFPYPEKFNVQGCLLITGTKVMTYIEPICIYHL